MEKWIVVEFNDMGDARVVSARYDTWEDACKVQNAMEMLHCENAYMIYTEDEWQWNKQMGWY